MIRLAYRLADWIRHRRRLKTWRPALAQGRRGEDLAHRFLQRRGYRVVARNYRPRSGAGEIDLVAWQGGTLAFVEVKMRSTEEYGTPDRAVDAEKRRLLIRAARDYARRAAIDWAHVRFDIVTVTGIEPPRLELLPGAFHAPL